MPSAIKVVLLLVENNKLRCYPEKLTMTPTEELVFHCNEPGGFTVDFTVGPTDKTYPFEQTKYKGKGGHSIRPIRVSKRPLQAVQFKYSVEHTQGALEQSLDPVIIVDPGPGGPQPPGGGNN
jgi:hypothetical protein